MSSPEVLVRVPASAANLGPGFDTLGLALGLHDEIEASLAPDGLVVEVTGEGAGSVPLTEQHLVVRALRAACAAFGQTPPGLRLRCRNQIPHGRGLGSSAAAAVAGSLAAAALLGRDPDAEREVLLQVAAGMDGHADNAAASLLGGLVVAWKSTGDDGADRFGAARLEPHAALRPVALVPDECSATAVTRGLLPERVPLADAAFTASRTALGVCAFTAQPSLLFIATEDRLHQPYRRGAYPSSAALMDRLRAHGVPAIVSGAGPTVLALVDGAGLPPGLVGPGFTERVLEVDRTGATAEVR
ncbi:homoserine kinase [Pseudonocardia sp.]|uniref:homoserine kinase n=1 Tax=Pseudonocardia sp. TaxID=60912 RepID=UPI002628C8D2|nr:homoserine kinase [Pseudonocardia sp.]